MEEYAHYVWRYPWLSDKPGTRGSAVRCWFKMVSGYSSGCGRKNRIGGNGSSLAEAFGFWNGSRKRQPEKSTKRPAFRLSLEPWSTCRRSSRHRTSIGLLFIAPRPIKEGSCGLARIYHERAFLPATRC